MRHFFNYAVIAEHWIFRLIFGGSLEALPDLFCRLVWGYCSFSVKTEIIADSLNSGTFLSLVESG